MAFQQIRFRFFPVVLSLIILFSGVVPNAVKINSRNTLGDYVLTQGVITEVKEITKDRRSEHDVFVVGSDTCHYRNCCYETKKKYITNSSLQGAHSQFICLAQYCGSMVQLNLIKKLTSFFRRSQFYFKSNVGSRDRFLIIPIYIPFYKQ